MLDEDGSMTGMGAGSWATAFFEHHNHTECETNMTYYGGVFCDNTVQVRRIAFSEATPVAIHRGMGLKILRYDDEIIEDYGNKTTYMETKTNYGSVFFKSK
jgi:hypothetical protein